MADKHWKQEARSVARLLGCTRYHANGGGRVDVEGSLVLAQVKHVKWLSLAALEALACEMAALGRERGKLGLLVVKRRAGRGQPTRRLIVMTDETWGNLTASGELWDRAPNVLSTGSLVGPLWQLITSHSRKG